MGQHIERLESLFKEESFGRLDASSIGISRFKLLEEFFNELIRSDDSDEIFTLCVEHHSEYSDSVTSAYLMGLISFYKNNIDGKKHLIELIKRFSTLQKWAVVEHLAQKVLEYGENSVALLALAQSLEKLKRRKEAIPVWEELLKLNRFNPEVAKKLAYSVEEEDSEKSTQYLKLALEGYVKNQDFSGAKEIWRQVIDKSWEDSSYLERIERMLADAGQKELLGLILLNLYEKYRDGDSDTAISYLKKELTLNPKNNDTRQKLIKLYHEKYKDHSQLKRFLDLSRLSNINVPVASAIASFEKNIIFDKDNYVYHRTWHLGKIQSIDSDNIIIDFRNKEGHRMSINMALQSLTALDAEHFYVINHEEPAKIQDYFKNNILELLRIIIKSFGGSVTVAEIKQCLIPQYVETKGWSRWWTKARNVIKKDPEMGFPPNKKDTVILREKPITFAEELLKRFAHADSFSSKLNIATEFANNVDIEEGKEHFSYFIDFFKDAAKEKSNTKLILSYFILLDFEKYSAEALPDMDPIKKKIASYIQDSSDLPLICQKISSYDNKKEFVNLIHQHREDWVSVAQEILFETPVRIHRYIINQLIIEKEFNTINRFIEKATTGAREFPEISLWIVRNIFLKSWNYEWLDYSRKDLTLALFRTYNALGKYEISGNRLKNMAYEVIFENDMKILKEIIDENDLAFLSKIYDIAANNEHIEESELSKFNLLIKAKFAEFNPEAHSSTDEDALLTDEDIIVTQAGYDKKSDELNRMVNVEMVGLQKELAKVADVSGDPRENVDYNALMEKQSVLKKSISKLDAELKQAKILDLSAISNEKVSIGSSVSLEDADSNEKMNITILGPWDVDFEKGILSYRSEAAAKLLGKKLGDEAILYLGGQEKTFSITELKPYQA